MHNNNHLANVNLLENDYGEHVLQEEWGQKTAKKLFGGFSGKTKVEKETWWWNEDLQESIQKKRLVKRTGKGKRLIVRSDTCLAEQRDCGGTQAHLYSRLVLLKTE